MTAFIVEGAAGTTLGSGAASGILALAPDGIDAFVRRPGGIVTSPSICQGTRAVVSVFGPQCALSYAAIAIELGRAVADPRVTEIVLRIDSAGGDVHREAACLPSRGLRPS